MGKKLRKEKEKNLVGKINVIERLRREAREQIKMRT